MGKTKKKKCIFVLDKTKYKGVGRPRKTDYKLISCKEFIDISRKEITKKAMKELGLKKKDIIIRAMTPEDLNI